MLHASIVILCPLDESSRFVDVLDAQWACEGELIPLDVQTLNPREFLAYQHGLFLLKLLHTLKLVSIPPTAFLPLHPLFKCD